MYGGLVFLLPYTSRNTWGFDPNLKSEDKFMD